MPNNRIKKYQSSDQNIAASIDSKLMYIRDVLLASLQNQT